MKIENDGGKNFIVYVYIFACLWVYMNQRESGESRR